MRGRVSAFAVCLQKSAGGSEPVPGKPQESSSRRRLRFLPPPIDPPTRSTLPVASTSPQNRCRRQFCRPAGTALSCSALGRGSRHAVRANFQPQYCCRLTNRFLAPGSAIEALVPASEIRATRNRALHEAEKHAYAHRRIRTRSGIRPNSEALPELFGTLASAATVPRDPETAVFAGRLHDLLSASVPVGGADPRGWRRWEVESRCRASGYPDFSGHPGSGRRSPAIVRPVPDVAGRCSPGVSS